MRNPVKNAVHSLFHNPKHFVAAILYRVGGFIPDKPYLRWIYYLETNNHLNLENPQRFGEKIQWLKLYNHNPLYTTMVDKYRVKELVSERLGTKYIIPTIADWDSPQDTNWAILPEQFVIKTNHDGGGNGIVICKDKASLSLPKAIKELNRSFRRNSFKKGREWPYKNVVKRVFAEKYIQDSKGEQRDYKFFCFNGKVRCFKVDFNRQIEHRANYFDRHGQLQFYGEASFPPDYNAKIELPNNIGEMISLAEKLANDIPFVRVDFYNIDGQIYFGELTFFPAGGLSKWVGETDVDALWGSWLELKVD